MPVLTSIDELGEFCADGSALAIGMFDGVHRGHQALFELLADKARRLGVPSVALTFPEHPLATLAPPYAPKLLSDPEQKAELISALGVDAVALIPFTGDFSQTEPLPFIERFVALGCRARTVVCGPDFRFGRAGAGTLATLEAEGPRLGYDVAVRAAVHDHEGEIRSTRVRGLLYGGDVRRAAQLLGRHYTLGGKVVRGDQRGRAIGFPTANLDPASGRLVPFDGVYAVRASVAGLRFDAMMNIGVRPTFRGELRTHEVHFFDFNEDIYGQRVEVEFVARVREEMRFDSVDQLSAQLRQDREECANLLKLG